MRVRQECWLRANANEPQTLLAKPHGGDLIGKMALGIV